MRDEIKTIAAWVGVLSLVWAMGQSIVGNIYASIGEKADKVEIVAIGTKVDAIDEKVESLGYMVGFNTGQLNLLLDANGIVYQPQDSTRIKRSESR